MNAANETLRITKATETCYMCPRQWDARDAGGRRVFIDYQGGYLTIEVEGANGMYVAFEGAVSAADPYSLFLTEIPDLVSGVTIDLV